jgi:hypothetical protein
VTRDELQTLVSLKRAREQRAMAALTRCRAAEAQAVAARQQTGQAVSHHAAHRLAQESAIYASLLAEPLPARRLQSAAAQLARMAAYDAVLRRQLADASRVLARRVEDRSAAALVRSRAEQRAAAMELLADEWHAESAAAEERCAEYETEETTEDARRSVKAR